MFDMKKQMINKNKIDKQWHLFLKISYKYYKGANNGV